MDSGITVTGTGTVVAPPDMMRADLTTEFAAQGMQEALDGATLSLQRMRDAFVSAAPELASSVATDLATSDVSVWPEHDHMQQVVGYRAALGVTILVRNLDTAAPLLSRIVEQGGPGARLNGMTMQHSDPDGLVGRARDAAWRDAQMRAQQYANLAGLPLGPVQAVTEVSGGFDNQPVQVGYGDDGAETGIEPQHQSVSVAVTVRWSLS